MHAIKDTQGNIINNFKEIVKAAEGFYSEMYSSQTDHTTLIEIESAEDTDIPCITTDEVKKGAKGMSRGEQQVKTA